MSTPDLLSTSYSLGEKTGTTTFYMGHGRTGEWKLTGLSLVPTQAISADGSNKFVIAVTETAGSGTVCTSFDTSSTALVAGTGVQFTMTTTAGTDAEFGPTDSIKLVCTETGTATLDAVFYAHWQKVRA
jgi:hypothetical protein